MTDIEHVDGHGVISPDPLDDDVPDTTRMLGDSSGSDHEELTQTTGGRQTSININHNHDEDGEEDARENDNGDGDELGRDNAVGAEAQNLLNMQNEISRPMSFLGFLRRGNFFLILYFIPVTVSLITVLIVDWNSTCNKPLKAWACTQVGIQSIMILVHIMFLHKLQNPENERPRQTSPLYVISKILNFLWFTWFIVGMVWTFQALAEDKCTSTAPYLFRMCFSLTIIQIIILSLGVLFCCCSCVVLILRVVMNPVDRAAAPRGASDDIISALPTKRFKDGLVKKEDASCAICLSDYETDEVVRFLPCGHHYHRNCVDKWLITNKACPFCKRNVDDPPPPSGVFSSSPTPPASPPSDSVSAPDFSLSPSSPSPVSASVSEPADPVASVSESDLAPSSPSPSSLSPSPAPSSLDESV